MTEAITEDLRNKPFYRTHDGYYRNITNVWGTHFVKVRDPKGNPAPPELNSFWLTENFDKVPMPLLQAIVSFFRHYIQQGQKVRETEEVQVLLLRKEDDLSIWNATVPTQVIGGVTVDAVTATGCFLLTGEEYKVFPPEGWLSAGSIH